MIAPCSRLSTFDSRGRPAFSLIEVLIAIALTLALSSAMFGFYYDMLGSRRRAMEHTAGARAATTLMERLEADLLTCVVGDGRVGAGVRGDETSLRVLARGAPITRSTRGDGGWIMGDLRATDYRHDAMNRQVMLSRAAASGAGGSSGARTDGEPLGGTIHHLRFRYYDGTEWRRSFDSLRADQLPRAVEVAVWFNPWPGDETIEQAQEPDEATHSARRDIEPPDDLLEETMRDDPLAADDGIKLPAPDRLRIIVVPDAAPPEGDAAPPEGDADAGNAGAPS